MLTYRIEFLEWVHLISDSKMFRTKKLFNFLFTLIIIAFKVLVVGAESAMTNMPLHT